MDHAGRAAFLLKERDRNPALTWNIDRNVMTASRGRWAHIAASTSAYHHARIALRGKDFEDHELRRQDRPNRRRFKTSRDRNVEIVSEPVRKQLISKLCLCQCVPKFIMLLLSRTAVRMPCGSLESLSRMLHYQEGPPCVGIETAGLTD